MSEVLEFLFGRLSTPEGRLAEARSQYLGFFDLSDLDPLDPVPGEPVKLRFRTGVDISLERIDVYFTTDGSVPEWKTDHSQANSTTIKISAVKTSLFFECVDWGYAQDWEVLLPPMETGTTLKYVAIGVDGAGQSVPCPTPGRDRHGSPRVGVLTVDQTVPPAWFHEAVIYHVFVDRFAPTPGGSFQHEADLGTRMGGTLWGVIAQLDHIADLGFNTLWLSPIFSSPDYHGYSASSFETIEELLGGVAAWTELVRQVKLKKIRIILDFVANHISDRHPAFVAAQKSPDAPEVSWFRFSRWPDQYSCFFNVPSQPEVDGEIPAVRDLMIAAAKSWLGRGADGFRLDYAHGLSHGFWSIFRDELKKADPDSICFGEITETPRVVRSYKGRLDGSLDFPLCELLRKTFALERIAIGDFDRYLRRHLDFLSSDFVSPSFIDNHDMNRFLWLAKGDHGRLKLAALIQFLLPGPPILYYGTEVGLSQLRDVGRLEEARLPMPDRQAWANDLVSFFRELVLLRKQVQPWRHPIELIHLEESQGWVKYRIGKGQLWITTHSPMEGRVDGSQVLISTRPRTSPDPSPETISLGPWSGIYLRTPVV